MFDDDDDDDDDDDADDDDDDDDCYISKYVQSSSLPNLPIISWS